MIIFIYKVENVYVYKKKRSKFKINLLFELSVEMNSCYIFPSAVFKRMVLYYRIPPSQLSKGILFKIVAFHVKVNVPLASSNKV